jgi:hypothetical protein
MQDVSGEQRRFLEILEALRMASDVDLKAMARRHFEQVSSVLAEGSSDRSRVAEALFYFRIRDELARRANIIGSLEADMQGGHLVRVVLSEADPDWFYAECDPRPGTGEPCWAGPPRSSPIQAMEDGRRHNPGFEPFFDDPDEVPD